MNTAIRFVTGQLRRASFVRDPNEVFNQGLSVGERLADRVAAIGGSWGFIIGFSLFLLGWAALNSVVLARHPIDPFPYVFLNLLLSMVAALQAPIIMMSQNRQAAKDRLEARLDYETNQRAEEQIGHLLDEVSALRGELRAMLETRAGVDA
jgi:uncharacterized membrane protein